jgi:hypothetical protein
MAVDTRDKRSSAMSFQGTPIFPNPDGAITSVEDRQHMAYTYAYQYAITAGFICLNSETIGVPLADGSISIPESTGSVEVC